MLGIFKMRYRWPSSSPHCTNFAFLRFPGFRVVTFTLQAKDVLCAVVDVLKSCSLSVEHMQGLQTATSQNQTSSRQDGIPFYRPIKWDKTYYTFTGFKDPEQELEQAKKVETTLRLTQIYTNKPVSYSRTRRI